MTPEDVEKIRLNLIDYITGTVDEWLRLAHFDQTPEDRDGIQLRIAWEHPSEGRMIAGISEQPAGDPLVRFGVDISVSPLHAGSNGSCPSYGSRLDPCPAGCASGVCVAGKSREIRPPEMVRSAWIPATFLMCLAGDRIRVGGQETDVLKSSSGVWHANNSDAWHPTPWVHTELRMDLAANPGFQQYPPNTPCEILMGPERLAVHMFMQTFPGTTVVSS